MVTPFGSTTTHKGAAPLEGTSSSDEEHVSKWRVAWSLGPIKAIRVERCQKGTCTLFVVYAIVTLAYFLLPSVNVVGPVTIPGQHQPVQVDSKLLKGSLIFDRS